MDFFLSFISYGVTGIVYRMKQVVGLEGRCDLVRILFTGGVWCLEFCYARRFCLCMHRIWSLCRLLNASVN